MRISESRLRRAIRQVINENDNDRQNIPETMINVDPLIKEIMKLSEKEKDYLIIKIAPLIWRRDKLLGYND